MSALLELSGLEVAYGPSQVLFGLDLALAEGEAATLLGRNGMGKTTTLRAICGLEAVKDGTIRLENDLYEVDLSLRGLEVRLRFDPWTRQRIEVDYRGQSFGLARLVDRQLNGRLQADYEKR